MNGGPSYNETITTGLPFRLLHKWSYIPEQWDIFHYSWHVKQFTRFDSKIPGWSIPVLASFVFDISTLIWSDLNPCCGLPLNETNVYRDTSAINHRNMKRIVIKSSTFHPQTLMLLWQHGVIHITKPFTCKFFQKNQKYIFTFYILPPHKHGIGSWNPLPCNTTTYLFYLVNIMGGDAPDAGSRGISSHDIR